MSTVSKIPENEWLTKQEAARYLDVAERTLDRLASRGNFQKRSRRRPGQQTIAVYHAADLERYAAERAAAAAAKAFPVPATALTAPGGSAILPVASDALTRLADLLAGRINPLIPLYIPLTEAAARLGLNERYVRQCVREGKLRAVRLVVDGRRVTKVRAADLEGV